MQRFKNILFVANNESGDICIERAAALAQRNTAKLTLLDVIDTIPTWAGKRSDRLKWESIHKADLKARKQRLEHAAKSYQGKIVIETKVLEGKKFLHTIRHVLKHDIDLVMKDAATHSGAIQRIFATEDMHLLRKCPCPILLTKSGSKGGFKNIMAAIDFDDLNDLESPTANNSLNQQILDMSISFAHEERSHLDIVHVYQIIGEGVLYGGRTGMTGDEVAAYIDDIRGEHEHAVSKLLEHAKKRLGEQIHDAVSIRPHIIKGNAKIAIPEQAELLKTDLVVMGTVARTGIPGFFIGNTAETILNNIDCSVLAVKPEGFISPVTLM